MHEHLRNVSKALMKVLGFSESVDFAFVFNYLMVGVANVYLKFHFKYRLYTVL